MHISPVSKASIRTKFFNNKEKEKEKEKKEIEKKSLSKILYSQKKYIKMISTQKLISRNIDYIKKNSYKVMLRNKSNIEHTIKFASNENSENKNEDNLTNRTKNLINYNADIYTPKHSKHNSTTNVYNQNRKANNKNDIANITQQKHSNLINNNRKNNLFIKNLIKKESNKDKNENKIKNNIFSFPVSPKNNNKNNGNVYSNLDNDFSRSKMVKSFMLSQKPEIPFKNFSSNSSLNIFRNNNIINHESNNDSNINLHNNNKKYKNKNKGDFNMINFNNKNLGAYLKKIYFNNRKINKENNEATNRNNNYILINHLLLNDINITGNSNGNLLNENLEISKYKSKTSRNDKNLKNVSYKQKIYSLNNENHFNNNDFINGENYINMAKTNCENVDIKTKFEFHKNKYNSPEENHFSTVYYLQNMKISNNKIK
jgi:hypothetical protein